MGIDDALDFSHDYALNTPRSHAQTEKKKKTKHSENTPAVKLNVKQHLQLSKPTKQPPSRPGAKGELGRFFFFLFSCVWLVVPYEYVSYVHCLHVGLAVYLCCGLA